MLTWVVIAVGAVAAAWLAAVWWTRRVVRRHDGSGDPSEGIIIFVEPVRWLFIIWGFVSACRGLRRAGLNHVIHLFQWSHTAGSLLVLPDLMRRARLDAKAGRLVRLLVDLSRRHPGSTIHLIGYSSGAYVAFEAVKALPAEVRLGRVIVLHGTVSPEYDLAPVAARAGVVNIYSRIDCLINGLGPLLFGTNDRVHAPACGMVGFRGEVGGVEQHCWSWADVRDGYWGDHFTVMSSAWICRNIGPLLKSEL
jgi:pimeloyl-ACP methyl ester carboxylesterase